MDRRSFIKKITLGTAGLTLFGTSKTKAEIAGVLRPDIEHWDAASLNIAWLGHSTLLINFYGKIIITDPVLFERVGVNLFGFTYGPSRYTMPALLVDEIPKPDLVLLSHGHMDHTDYKTLNELTARFPGELDCITSYNTKDITEELPWKSIRELDWGEKLDLNWIKIQTLEVKHFGWRYPWEKDRSRGFFRDGRSFNAYILERNSKKILFGGDTAYTPKFKSVNERVDVAIMPIGAYSPWIVNHCTPEEAVSMAADLNAKVFIPIHFQTFRQGTEPIHEPLERLKKGLTGSGISLGLEKIGQVFSLI